MSTTAAVTMSAATSLPPPAAYPSAKHSYYPGSFPFPFLSNSYMYGATTASGGGTVALAHPPPHTSVNSYSPIVDSTMLNYEMNGHSTESLISSKQSQTLDRQLSSPPPQPPPPVVVSETHHHRARLGSVEDGSISPLPPSVSSPAGHLSPNPISSLSMATPSVSALSTPLQPYLQQKPTTFNVSATVAGGLGGNGFPRLPATQHHFPAPNAFPHVPSTLGSFQQPYGGFSPAASATHHTTISNVMPLYPHHHHQALDYTSSHSLAPLLSNWNQYPSSIHSPKLSYDSPRYKLTPERATPLQKWFDEHREHPYPTRHDKILLCQETNLTFTQVSTWFANCRRRLKKATQEDEERHGNTSSLSSTSSSSGPHHNGSGNGRSSAYPDEATPTERRLCSTSPVPDDSPCSSGRHDSDEKLHDYGDIHPPTEEFEPLTYDSNSSSNRKSRVPSSSHH